MLPPVHMDPYPFESFPTPNRDKTTFLDLPISAAKGPRQAMDEQHPTNTDFIRESSALWL